MGYYSTIKRTDFHVPAAKLSAFYKHMTGRDLDPEKGLVKQLNEILDEYLTEGWRMKEVSKKVYKVFEGDVQVDEIVRSQYDITGFASGEQSKHYENDEFLRKLSTFDPEQMICCEEWGEDDDRWMKFAYGGKLETAYPETTYLNPFTNETVKGWVQR